MTECFASYEQRPNRTALEQAIRCFASLPDPSFSSLEGQIKALAYAVLHFNRRSDREAQRTWVNEGLMVATRLETLATSSQELGAAKYWKGTFITFDKSLLDNLPIGEEPPVLMLPPLHMLNALDEIRTLFIESTRLNRRYHGCGALRNIGIMYYTQPENFFPGSTGQAVASLQEAYYCDPWFSLNVIYYAKALRKANRRTEALTFLNYFIETANSNPMSYGADRLQETREDLETARVLLARIRSEL